MGNTSDGEFRGNLNSKFGMIDDALKRRYPEWNFGRDWQGPGPPPPRIDMKAYDDKYAHLVELWPLVEQFGDASVEGAQYEIDCLDRVIEKLARQAEDDHATRVERIYQLIDGWKGTAASEFYEIVMDLEESLQSELEFAVGLRGLMRIHRDTLLTARHGILQICNETVEAIDRDRIEQNAIELNGVGDLLAIAFETAVKLSGGGVVETLKGALTDVGKSLAGSVSGISESGVTAIFEDMKSSIQELRRTVMGEEEKLRAGLTNLETYTRGGNRPYIIAPLVAAA